MNTALVICFTFLISFSFAELACTDISFANNNACGALASPYTASNGSVSVSVSGNLWGVPVGCSFRLGNCNADSFLTQAGIGCDSNACLLNFTVTPPTSSFSISIWTTSASYSPIDIKVATVLGQVISSSISREGVECQVPSTFTYAGSSAEQLATWFTITGDYELVSGLQICNNSNFEPLCADTTLYLYTGEAGCSPINPNECFTCSLGSNTFYYTANCTTLPTGVCSCRSFIYEGIYCTGKILPQPAINQSCSEIRTFYPNTNSTCQVIASPPPPTYNIAIYGGGDSDNCTVIPTGTCFSCSQKQVTAYYQAKCEKENVCFMTQYSDDVCSAATAIFPVPPGDCNSLYSSYNQFQQSLCAFGVPPLSTLVS